MAKLVAGYCIPHDPLMAASPEIQEQAKADTLLEGMEIVNKKLINADVDTVIVIGDDHYCKFGPQCLPQFLIGIGDLEGPEEPWLNIQRYAFPNNVGLATHIMNTGFDQGFDWAVAKTLTLDHGTMVPVHLAVKPKDSGMKSIPIYTASGVEPLLRTQRAFDLGKSIASAISSYEGDERVAILGTGGISHFVGTRQMGYINEEFDQMVLDYVREGNVQALIDMDDKYVEETAGNGAFEIRNWIIAMSVMQASGADLICYEPIPEWICGCAILELKAA